jgi:hypothetical protein
MYDDFLSLSEGGNPHRIIQELLVNDRLQCSSSLFTGQTRHKNNNNLIIYKSSQLDKPVCKDLYEIIQLMKKRNLSFIN